jgi:hypothetical protein
MGLLGFAFASSEVIAAYVGRFEVVAFAGVAAIGAGIDLSSGSKSAKPAHDGA